MRLEVAAAVGGRRRWFYLDLRTEDPTCALEDLAAAVRPGGKLGQCTEHSTFASEGERWCAFQCRAGYAARAGTQVFCGGEGRWVAKEGSAVQACAVLEDFCKEEEVEETRGYKRGGIQCRHAAVGEECQLQCAQGYRPAAKVKCLETGRFSQPQCEYAGPCPLDGLVHGQKGLRRGTCTDLMPGESCSYVCAVGYNPKANAVFCTEKGWMTPAECELVPDYCSVKDIKGPHVLPGTCTDR